MGMVFVVMVCIGENGSDVNGSNDELEKKKEDSRCEPTVEDSPECW